MESTHKGLHETNTRVVPYSGISAFYPGGIEPKLDVVLKVYWLVLEAGTPVRKSASAVCGDLNCNYHKFQKYNE